MQAIQKLNAECTRKIEEEFARAVNIEDDEPEEDKHVSGKLLAMLLKHDSFYSS